MDHYDKRQLDISIHAPREGGDCLASLINFDREISIHAPREGGDTTRRDIGYQRIISIHAPREGGDSLILRHSPGRRGFQSTPPARGATAKMHSFICESLTNK